MSKEPRINTNVAFYVFFKNDSFLFFILWLFMFCLHVHLCEHVGSTESGLTDSCELPCGYWALDSGPLEEQPVLLTFQPFLYLQH